MRRPEAMDRATYAHLVALLKHQDVAVRQLALDNLVYLTKRDALGYDPDKPEGPGLKAWQTSLFRDCAGPTRPAPKSARQHTRGRRRPADRAPAE